MCSSGVARWGIGWLVLVAACSGAKSQPPSKGALGDVCARHEECESGRCVSTPNLVGCTVACATDDDCQDNGAYLECGVLADGSRACLPGCYLVSGVQDFACVDGVPTSCALLGEEHCDECGCGGSGRTCVTGMGCIPMSDVGGPCDGDEDCNSNNCSAFAGVCRVPLGASCSSSDCDYCLSGWSCSRECDGPLDCPGGHCLGRVDTRGQPTGVYYCLPTCSPSASACDGNECRWHSSQFYYCDIYGTHAPRAIGQPCRDQAQCPSPAYCLGDTTASGLYGYCTLACLSSADCGADIACVAVGVCDPGATCEGRCLPACDEANADSCAYGACAARIGADTGTRVTVCSTI